MPEQRVLLKSVKLKGFLSFREGTVEFSPGLNVVVGPNGSGKSSIFHAIKFALGSNQREGRYERWSGFVRHGEDSAYVEVTVEVEGKEKRLGRKIDRDGVPRCYVDGRIVKAGVLRSEVERLGFNVDNTLVFMPQERINALRDLDPIEVRNLVEEGTGLAVMRDQIADQQMLISHDSEILESTISERTLVEHELQLIQRDLQRLFRKRQLLDTRVKLQLELQWASLDELVSLEMRLMDEIDRHKEGLSSLAREIQAVESDMASYQKQQNVIQERIESVQQEIGAIKTLLEERGKQLSDTRGKNERSLAELRHLQQSIREAESRISEFSGQLKRISADKERLSDMRALRSSEMSALQAELEKVERDLEAYSEWNEKRTEAQTRHREILAEMRALEAEHRALVRSMQRDQAELDEIMRRWGHIWTILERADRSDLERKRTTLQSEVTRYDRTLYELRSEMDRLQRESQDLHTRLQETSGHVPESVLRLKEAIRDHGLNDVVGPLLDMLPCDSEYARALDAVLMGDLPFSFIVRERADFLLLERLRDKYNAPSPVILIQERDEHPPLPDSQGVIGWLWDLVTADESVRELLRGALGEVLLVDSNRAAMNLVPQGSLTVVTAGGNVLVHGPSSTISYPPREQTGLVSTAPLHRRLEEIEQRMSHLLRDVAEAESQKSQVTRELEDTQTILSQLDNSDLWERRNRLQESVAESTRHVSELKSRIDELAKEREESERHLRSLDSKQPPERSRLIGARSALRDRHRRLLSEIDNVDAGLRHLDDEASSVRVRINELEAALNLMHQREQDLTNTLSEAETETASLMREIDVLEHEMERARDTAASLSSDAQQVRAQLESLTKRRTELYMIEEDKRHILEGTIQRLKAAAAEKDSLMKELGKSERPQQVRSVSTVRGDLAAVLQLLGEYEDVNESIAQKDLQLRTRLGELADVMSRVRQEIAEAETTIADLREKYVSKMTEKLSRAEDEINSVLSVVRFPLKVRLELTERGGEYGIEFRTWIRGEDTVGVSGVSGGERSLVAIGLILALQRMNPAPVYLLDEIDIFLDAKNTELVSVLLHDCSRRSQFIVFTPAKSLHLLRQADRRIGVVSPRGIEPSVIIESPTFTSSQQEAT